MAKQSPPAAAGLARATADTAAPVYNPCALVRESCRWVLENSVAKHVTIDDAAITSELDSNLAAYTVEALPAEEWRQPFHYWDEADPEATVRYVLTVDTLNFCFWPVEGYEYDRLASRIKAVVLADREQLAPERLQFITEADLLSWLGDPDSPDSVPLLGERTRVLRELGQALVSLYGGRASALVEAAAHSAPKLVGLVTAALPAFRDHCVSRGKQLFFYKRAQILVGDLWGAFAGRGLGQFDDLDQLTCFADYRVPQVLRAVGILRYSERLAAIVDAKEEIESGSAMEIELRAATVEAVERLRNGLGERGQSLMAVQLDWVLWERGEASLDKLSPHHRVLSIYY